MEGSRSKAKKSALAGTDSVYDKTLPWKAKPEVGCKSYHILANYNSGIYKLVGVTSLLLHH